MIYIGYYLLLIATCALVSCSYPSVRLVSWADGTRSACAALRDGVPREHLGFERSIDQGTAQQPRNLETPLY